MPFKFEQRKQNLASVREFTKRMVWFVVFGLLFIVVSLSIGAIGYRHFAGLGWVDSYYNASMILTGMGPVAVLTSDSAKNFRNGVLNIQWCGISNRSGSDVCSIGASFVSSFTH